MSWWLRRLRRHLCARRRSCDANRRHDHRRRALGEDQDPCARGLRSLLGITLEFLKMTFAGLAANGSAEHNSSSRSEPNRALDQRGNVVRCASSAARPKPAGSTRRQPRNRPPPDRGDSHAPAVVYRPRPQSRRRRLGPDAQATKRLRPLAGHPQSLMRRLIGAVRDEVTKLGALSAALAARSAFLTEALEWSGGASERMRCPPPPSRPAFSLDHHPATKTKRRWRWRLPCATISRGRTRKQQPASSPDRPL